MISISTSLTSPLCMPLVNNTNQLSEHEFQISDLFANGENGFLGDVSLESSIWQDVSGTIPAILNSSLSRVDDLSGNDNNATKSSNPPILRFNKANSAYCIGKYSLTINFSGSLGSTCSIAIAYPDGGHDILENQTIGSSYEITVPWTYLIILDRNFTSNEKIILRSFLNEKSAADEIWHHVQGIGQSLLLGTNTDATGSNGLVLHSTNLESRAWMFELTGGAADYSLRTFLDTLPANNNTSLDSAFVTNITAFKEGLNNVVGGRYGETPFSGFITQYLLDDNLTEQYLLDVHGRGGTQYRLIGGAGLEPDTFHFSNGMIMQELGEKYVTNGNRKELCLINVHGEADASANRSRTDYANDLKDWVLRYNNHNRKNILRLRRIPMFYSQISNMFVAGAMAINMGQLDASDTDSDCFCIGPKYQLDYSDGTHLKAASEVILGEYYGKIARRVLKDNIDWKPLQPLTAVRSGAIITVTFHVPIGSLVIDTSIITPLTNYGITYSDSTTSASISSVVISSNNQVTITLNTTPTGSSQKLLFGATQSLTTQTGRVTGGRTQLRDEDTEMGNLSGRILYNFCVHAELGVTV